MPEYLTTGELAELLRLKERKIYDLAASGSIPCSRATGKLLFPRAAIDAWIAENGAGTIEPGRAPLPNVFLGSHDPLLDWALRESQSGIATFLDGSRDGLTRFAAREGIGAGLHLYDAAAEEWNVGAVKHRLNSTGVVLMEWAKRRRGLIVGAARQDDIRGLGDLGEARIAPRQPGAGAQDFFLHLAEQAGLSSNDLNTIDPLRTEQDVALAVLEDKADVAFGLEAIAAQYRLAFVPLIQEWFDLVVDRKAWFDPPLQRFFTFCRSDAFQRHALDLAGYDVSSLGTIHFNSP